ncbi:MAG: HPr family phosphocarrier protein, partial [Thiotrichales bacterium]|nr:HPr family phosphocarrier protein [Thiotrichales bacterium]
MRSEVRVVVTNPTGLHARPAVKLAQLAAGFDAHIEIRAGDDGDWVRARSTARVMKLKAGAQSTIHFRAEGIDADDALSALVDFVRRDFDEGPAAALPDGA